MKYITLFSAPDNKSYFKEEKLEVETKQALGFYSKHLPTSGLQFRKFGAGLKFDWHNAPQPQYIVYLEGEVEVEASGGEKKVFKAGDVLFANDLVGEGHISKTLTAGRSLIITTRPNTIEEDSSHSMKAKL